MTPVNNDGTEITSGQELLDQLLVVGNENAVSSPSSPTPPTTCHSLLRRNKAMPCQQVKDVMDIILMSGRSRDGAGAVSGGARGFDNNNVPPLSTLLCQAQEIMQTEFTVIGRKESTNIQPISSTTGHGDVGTTTSPALMAINTSTRLFRYFQLLLSIVDASSSNNSLTTTTTTTNTTTAPSNGENSNNVVVEITGRQVETWIADLLKTFIEAICRWIERKDTKDKNDGMDTTKSVTTSQAGQDSVDMEQCNDDDDDDPLMTDLRQQHCRNDVRPVAVFVWRMMIRFNQTYAAQRLGLLAPVWKNMTDLVSSIVRCQQQQKEAKQRSSDGGDEDDDNDSGSYVDNWHSDCFESLFEDTLENIHDVTHDGKVRLEGIAIEHMDVTNSQHDSSIVSTASAKQYMRHAKIMGFTAHKLCQLVKDYLAFVESKRSSSSTSTSKPNKPRLFIDIWRTLFGLRGMAAVFQELYLMDKSDTNDNDKLVCKIFCQVAAKTGDAIDGVNISPQDLLINIPAITMILQESASSQEGEEGDDNAIQLGTSVSDTRSMLNRFFLRLSRDVGRVLTLQRVLGGSQKNSQENIEPLVTIVENLLSTSVPRCLSICMLATETNHEKVPSITKSLDGALPSALVLNSLILMTRVITDIDRTLTSSSSDDKKSSMSGANNRLAAFHRLLLGWLSLNKTHTQQPHQQHRQQAHPLAREMIVLLVHKVILKLSFTSGQQGSAVRLLSYLVKIMFDERSSSELRRNVSSVLILLQNQSESSRDSTSSSSRPFDITDVTRSMLERALEFQFKSKDLLRDKKSAKKRKRETNGPRFSFQGCDYFLLLSQVFRQSSMSTSNSTTNLVGQLPSITNRIQQLYQDALTGSSTDHQDHVVLQSSTECNVISMSFLERLCRCDDVTENYQLPSGKIFDAICSIIRAVGKIEVRNDDNQSNVRNTVLLYSAALSLATTACIHFSNAEDLGKLFTCARKLFSTVVSFVTSIRKVVSSEQSKCFAALLSAESYALFGRLGRVVPNDCSSRHLEKLHQCSSQLSSVQDWAILTHGFTSIAAFGATISSQHYHILPKCLPESEELHNLFTNNFSDAKTPGRRFDRTAVCRKLCSMTGQLNPRIVPIERKIGQQSIFPSVTILQIDPGSYVLDMRGISQSSCYVIYPPGQKSLEELRDIISNHERSESDDAPIIQMLSRAIPLTTGGFKCLLQSHTL